MEINGLNNPYFEARAKGSTSIENGYLLFQRDENEFLVYKLNQFDKPLIIINKDVVACSLSPNKKFFVIGTRDNELILYKLNDSSNVTQFACLHLNEGIYKIVSSDQYIYIRLYLSNRFLTFKINSGEPSQC